MDIAFLIGRIIVGAYFLSSGMNHFAKSDMLSQYAKMRGAASGKGVMFGSGLLLLLGGLGILLGVYIDIAAALLIIFLLGVSLTVHTFWKDTDPQIKMVEMVNFLKNFALIGFLLMMLSIPAPWAFSLNI